MKITIKKAQAYNVAALTIGLFIIVSILTSVTILSEYDVNAANITNESVTTVVNVWNTEPVLYDIVISPNPIDLNPDNLTQVNCTGYFFDYNGWSDVAGGKVNATFYDVASGFTSGSASDENAHYRNASCAETCAEVTGTNGQNGTCTCSFNVEYFANASTWQCNMSIFDSGINITDQARNYTFNSTRYENVTVTELIALDVPPLINFGNLSVTELSTAIEENITNIGNTHINISIRGYGGDDETVHGATNYSMVCDYGNITLNATRYSFDSAADYFSNMTNLTNTFKNVDGLTVFQRTNDDNRVEGIDVNATYWKLRIPLSVGGQCNGTVIFSASDAVG